MPVRICFAVTKLILFSNWTNIYANKTVLRRCDVFLNQGITHHQYQRKTLTSFVRDFALIYAINNYSFIRSIVTLPCERANDRLTQELSNLRTGHCQI